MPTYEYKCTECNDVFEMMHGIEEQVESCPECGGKVRRLFHPVGIIFKGSGFYKTDSRKSSDNGGKKTSPEAIKEEFEKNKETSSSAKKESKQKSSKDSESDNSS